MTHDENIKQRLLAFVDEFGYEAVRKALTAVKRSLSPKRAANSTRAVRPLRPRKTAVEIVQAMDLPGGEKRDLLAALAAQFEDKRFMPNTNHARHFLAGIGKDSARIKSRKQAASSIFKTLATMDINELREIDDSGIYGPSKRLATYARAIGDFARDRHLAR